MSSLDLTAQINRILTEYGDEVRADLVESVEATSAEAVKKLKATSPKRSKKKSYASGWKAEQENQRTGVAATIHNKNKPGLTHLLENGHALRNGGRAKAFPHIKPVEEWANTEVLNKLERKLSQ